jgi:hypothetical protein
MVAQHRQRPLIFRHSVLLTPVGVEIRGITRSPRPAESDVLQHAKDILQVSLPETRIIQVINPEQEFTVFTRQESVDQEIGHVPRMKVTGGCRGNSGQSIFGRAHRRNLSILSRFSGRKAANPLVLWQLSRLSSPNDRRSDNEGRIHERNARGNTFFLRQIYPHVALPFLLAPHRFSLHRRPRPKSTG